jgi:hypothetical protein
MSTEPTTGRLEAEVILLRAALGRLLDAMVGDDASELEAARDNAAMVLGNRERRT